MIEISDRCPADHPCPLVSSCPAGAISQMEYGKPVIDDERCTGCNLCVKSCPKGAVRNAVPA